MKTPTTDPKTWSLAAQISLLATAALIGLLVVLLSLEGSIALMLRSDPVGAFGSDVWKRARREYYMRIERHVLQYLPECARYDPELSYRLKPGRCRFHNREFDHEIVVNSAGMRDREEALVAPEIVVTGDSFAMGWGVAQSEMVSTVLGELTGEKTLAAAEPSYGTAREMLLLRHVDLSAAHTLVIQYCDNDFIENARFVLAGGRLKTMGPDEYESTVADHLATARYWPGKHLRYFVPLLWRSLRGDDFASDWVRYCPFEARIFLGVLRRASLRDRPLRVVVFEATYTAADRSCFGAELTALARDRAQLPSWVSELQVVEPTSFLTESDYYPLDEHLNASGYRKIAGAIAELLARGPAITSPAS